MGLNLTNSSSIDESDLWYYYNKGLFWMLISISILIAFAGVIGNAVVIYAATKERNIGARFRYLNDVVKSLAITDFSLPLFGTPVTVVYWYWSKY